MPWTTIAEPPDGIRVTVASATAVYVLDQNGGWYSYDQNADTYTSLGTYPGGAPGQYIRGIYDPDDDTIWLFGKGETWQYTIGTDTWVAFTDDPNVTSRTSFACARVGRTVYCAGGYDSFIATDVVSAYDLDTDTWTLRSPLPADLGECCGAPSGTDVLIFGGDDVSYTYAATAYAYHTGADSYTTLSPPYDSAFAGSPTCTPLDATIEVFGGYGTGPSDDTYSYDPDGDTWTPGDTTPFAGLKQVCELDGVLYLFASEEALGARLGDPPYTGLAEITAELVALPDLASVGDVDMSSTFNRQWQEQLNDAGAGSISFGNDDLALDSVDLPNTLVNLFVRGVLAVTLLLKSFRAVDIAPGEEHDQITTYDGVLHLGLLDRCLVYPSNGVGRRPIERDRAFNWTAPSYDDSGWVAATIVTDAADAQTNWDAGDPDSQFDPDFPDAASASVLWASDGSVSDAGVGDCYFRQVFTVANTGAHTISALIDNYGEFYLDGQLVMHPGQEANLEVGFLHTSTYVAELTAGTHLVAVKATNAPGSGSNPGGVAYVIHESDALGRLGTLIAASDASALIVEYAVPDGMPMGQVINLLIAEGQARGEIPYVTTSFTDTEDSDGATFPLVLDAATKVGTTLLGALREWADTYIDFYMAPGTTVLDVWIKDTRGADVSGTVSYHRPTDPSDESTGNLLSLTRTGEAAVANDFLVDAAIGWSRQTSAGYVAADGEIPALLSLGALTSAEEVARVAAGQAALFAVTRVQTDIVIAPRDNAETPYIGYAGTGDTIDVEGVSHRVLSMAVSEDADNGRATFVPTLNDHFVLSSEERFAQAIRKMIPGSVGGRSRPAQPTIPIAQLRGRAPSPVFAATLDSVSLSCAYQGDSLLAMSLYGEGFTADATVEFSTPGVTVDSVTFVDATQLDIEISVSSSATPGGSSITITCNGIPSSWPGFFTVVTFATESFDQVPTTPIGPDLTWVITGDSSTVPGNPYTVQTVANQLTFALSADAGDTVPTRWTASTAVDPGEEFTVAAVIGYDAGELDDAGGTPEFHIEATRVVGSRIASVGIRHLDASTWRISLRHGGVSASFDVDYADIPSGALIELVHTANGQSVVKVDGVTMADSEDVTPSTGTFPYYTIAPDHCALGFTDVPWRLQDTYGYSTGDMYFDDFQVNGTC